MHCLGSWSRTLLGIPDEVILSAALPDITLVDTVTGAQGGGPGTLTLGWPGTVLPGDVGLIAVESANDLGVSVPTGFTEVDSGVVSPQSTGSSGGTSSTSLSLFYAVYASGSDIDIDFAGDHVSAALMVFRGVDNANPFSSSGDLGAGTTLGSGTVVTWPAVTTVHNRCLVVNVCTTSNDAAAPVIGGFSNASLSGLTEIVDFGTTLGNGGGIGASTGLLAIAGSTGSTTANVLSAPVKAAITVCLKRGLYVPPLSAPVFQAAGTVSTGGSGAALTPAWPSHVAGDIGILICNNTYNTTTTPATPSGWTLIGTVSGQAGGVKAVGTAWWKRAASGAESAPSVTTPATDPCCIAQVITIRGAVATGNPIEAIATSGSASYPNLTVTAPGATTEGDDRLVVSVFCAFKSSDGTAQVLSGATNADFTATENSDVVQTVSGEQVGIAVVTGTLATQDTFASTSGTSGAGTYTAWGNITFAVRPDIGWSVDWLSGVAMPKDATEYSAWMTASAFTTPFPTPASLYRDPTANASLVDRIGSRTLVLTGTTAVGSVSGWATPEVHLTGAIDSCWFDTTSENLTTTAVAAFAIVELTGAAREESVLSLGGVGAGNCLEARMTSSENVKGQVGGASATGGNSYTGQVVGIFMVYRPGSSTFSVYVKPVGGSVETITPGWAGTAAGGSGMYVLSGWNNSSSSKLLRLEYWTGTDADSIGASAVGEFFTRRGF